MAALHTAVELYTGPYLSGSPHQWAHNASRSLEADIVKALTRLAQLEAETEPERALYHLEKATEIDTTNEDLYRQRMQAHADLGQPRAVQHCYEELAGHLAPRRVKPERATTELYERLAHQV